jgi:energy-coupling factor transporter ATP-binding protein EcfA2
VFLSRLTYHQHPGQPNEWGFSDLLLKPINLVVGKNATGKTRVLNVINGLAKLVSGEQRLAYRSGDYEAVFSHGDGDYRYSLAYEDSKVHRENLIRGKDELLARGVGGVGKIFTKQLGRMMDFQSPENELAVVNRLDAIQHDFFTPLVEWGKSTFHYSFGTPLGRTTLAVLREGVPDSFDPKKSDQVIEIFRRGLEQFGQAYQQRILDDMGRIGYPIEEVGTRTPREVVPTPELAGEVLGLYVKEARLTDVTEQFVMSQGMFRVLSIVIQLAFNAMAMSPSCVLIDDIGEGLDFERSCALIELIQDRAKESEVQFVLSTNDRFTMNNIPLENWTVVTRDGGQCHIHNYENSRNLFEEFRFTGLSNFDLLATDFLSSNHR